MYQGYYLEYLQAKHQILEQNLKKTLKQQFHKDNGKENAPQ